MPKRTIGRDARRLRGPGATSSPPAPARGRYELPATRVRSRGAFILALAGLALSGCARNAPLDARIDQLAADLAEVETLGATRCAPRELAIAQSQLEFARLEREQGDTARSLAHLDVGDENLRAAKLLAAPALCATPPEVTGPSAPSPAPPAP